MYLNQFYLFKDRRFLPIFLVQLFGCLNDSIVKNAIIILVMFKLAGQLALPAHILVLIANSALVLPFFIFASLAGQICDKFERAKITRILKIIELFFVVIAIYAFKSENVLLLFMCLFGTGIQSAFFGPIKYSVLPDKLKKTELLEANGYVEAGTFMAILIGTIIGGFYNINENIVLSIAFFFAICGLISSYFMPDSGNEGADVKINWNLWQETSAILRYSYNKKHIYLSILGISWFWFIGAAMLSQIPALTRDILGADENVANLFLATFSIGVGFGSFWCSKIFENEITTKYVFLSALGISLFSIDLYFATSYAEQVYQSENFTTIIEFFTRRHYIRILFDLFFIAAIGGLYVVPLFAVLQSFSNSAFRSRIIAANNLINSLFMVGSTILLSVFYYMNISIPGAILLISIMNLVVSFHIYHLIPNSNLFPLKAWRAIFRALFDLFYKVEVKGYENYAKAGDKTVIVANHLSYIDPALLATYIPEKMFFAINLGVSQKWWVKPFLKIVRSFPIDPNNPMAIKSLIQKVRQKKKIAIFPEGRISLTGSLMKIYEGPGMIADKSDAVILPIRIDGTQFTIFSKIRDVLKGGFRLRRKITITILPPVKINAPSELDNRQRRKYISQAIYDIMSDMMFESSDIDKTLFQSLISSAKIYNMNKVIMSDVENNSVTYRSLLMKSFVMAYLFAKKTQRKEHVGLMLPNMVASAIVFFGIQGAGRVPAMINFTIGASNIISSCKTALVSTIYTSRKFVKKAELEQLVEQIEAGGIKILYLEDLRGEVTLGIKLKALISSLLPSTFYETLDKTPDASGVGVILFTSGTESVPKAVALSHRNILANRCQVLARIDLNPHDSAFNTLPMFHTFGLTGMLIMALSGVPSFFYPSPLHYRIIPVVIYDIGATIMFATDTFLAGYANFAHPYDFYSLRYVFAGAEKLKSKTQEMWINKFGVRVFEGYGVTESAPVISVNTSMHQKSGTVGRFLPKIEHRILPVDGIEHGGKLCVRGPNVMLGYIRPENPGQIIPTSVDKLGEGWYDTGDIVDVDDEGYVTILGRQKRFAKIGGEMVSLVAVEEAISSIDKDSLFAAVSADDEKKGEQVILFTDNENITKDQLVAHIRSNQLSELLIPKTIIHISEIPVLGTGKIDYRQLNDLAKNSDSK